MVGVSQILETIYDAKSGVSSIIVSRGHGKNTKSFEYTENQDAIAILTPTAGYKLHLVQILISTESDVGEVLLDFVTSSQIVSRLYVSKRDHDDSGEMHVEGNIDEALTLTTSTGDNKVHIRINYRESK